MYFSGIPPCLEREASQNFSILKRDSPSGSGTVELLFPDAAPDAKIAAPPTIPASMKSKSPPGLLAWLKRRFAGQAPAPLSDLEQARQLIAAIDRGGLPLNPARVNAIARNLGLEVSRRAPVEATIERIRQAIARAGG